MSKWQTMKPDIAETLRSGDVSMQEENNALRAELVAAQERITEMDTMLAAYETDCANIEGVLKGKGKTIAELQAEVERLREAARWIPVEERLPEDDPEFVKKLPPCLVYLKSDCVTWGQRFFTYHDSDYRKALDGNADIKECWLWWNWNAQEMTVEVTHWMPLPQPPEATL